jgi:hypothetical protein
MVTIFRFIKVDPFVLRLFRTDIQNGRLEDGSPNDKENTSHVEDLLGVIWFSARRRGILAMPLSAAEISMCTVTQIRNWGLLGVTKLPAKMYLKMKQAPRKWMAENLSTLLLLLCIL